MCARSSNGGAFSSKSASVPARAQASSGGPGRPPRSARTVEPARSSAASWTAGLLAVCHTMSILPHVPDGQQVRLPLGRVAPRRSPGQTVSRRFPSPDHRKSDGPTGRSSTGVG